MRGSCSGDSSMEACGIGNVVLDISGIVRVLPLASGWYHSVSLSIAYREILAPQAPVRSVSRGSM